MKRKVKQPLDGQQILKYQQNQQSPLTLKKASHSFILNKLDHNSIQGNLIPNKFKYSQTGHGTRSGYLTMFQLSQGSHITS